MRLAIIGVAVGLAFACAATAGPREVVHACVRHAPDRATGLDELEAACPGLTSALDALGITPLLSDATRAALARDKLGVLIRLGAPDGVAPGVAPSRDSLEPILRALTDRPAPQTWWERFKAWVRAHLAGDTGDATSPWLQDWFRRLTPSQLFLRVSFFLLAALVIASAIAIIVNEVRAAGTFGARRAAQAASARAATGGDSTPRVSLADVEAAPAHLRAAAMFRLLLRRLTEAGRLGPARDRTHRELRSMPPFSDPLDRTKFVRLAEVAEQQLFAAVPVPLARVGAALADGEALIGSIGSIGSPGGSAR